MHDNAAQRLTGQLPTNPEGGVHYEEIAGWPVSRLRDLGVALATRIEPGRVEYHRSELGVIERVLALTSGVERARAGIELALVDAASDSLLPQWRMAALLAAGQPAEVLISALTDARIYDRAAELWACLLQEIVIRGVDLSDVFQAVALRERLISSSQSLAALPLHLLPGEEELPIQTYAVNGSGSSEMPYLLTRWEKKSPVVVDRSVNAVRVTTEVQRRKLAAAVQGWVDGSNGRVEADIFEFAEPLAEDSFDAGVLCALQLECLRDMEPGGLVFRSASFSEVVTTLFGAAADGGSYAGSSERGGAHGRMALWESVAALIGVDPESAIEDIAASANALGWWRFQAVAPWFEQESVEFGFVVVRADRYSCGILAATDTD